MTLRTEERVVKADVRRALSGIPVGGQPNLVHEVDQMPMTSWHRPSVRDLSGASTIGTVLYRRRSS